MLRVLPFLLCCCAAWAQTAIPLETARGVAEVPPQPAKIAVFDWAALDSLEQLGVPVGATTAKMEIDYLAPVFARAQTVGTVFEPDYEALARYQPDLVITGGPGAEAFPRLAAHWPTIDMTIDNAAIRESGKARITAFGKLFDKESEAARLIDDIDQSSAADLGHGRRPRAGGAGDCRGISETARPPEQQLARPTQKQPESRVDAFRLLFWLSGGLSEPVHHPASTTLPTMSPRSTI